MQDHQNILTTLALPVEFIERCRADNVEPGTVLRGFVADLCSITDAEAGFVCNGTQASDLACWYYAHVGYVWWPRGELVNQVDQAQALNVELVDEPEKPVVVTLHVELSEEQALAFAQFVKQAGYAHYRVAAENERQAVCMVHAGERLRRAFIEASAARAAGVQPGARGAQSHKAPSTGCKA